MPEGTFFVVADAAPLGVTDAVAFCRSLPEAAGVVGIPVQVFCDDPGPYASLVRFAFPKRLEVLEAAVAGLRRLGGGGR